MTLVVGRWPLLALAAFHLYALIIDVIPFISDGVDGPGGGMHYGWILVYLTNCNLATHILYFLYSLCVDYLIHKDTKAALPPSGNDVLPTETGLSPLTRRLLFHRDRFFGVCASVGTVVAVAYWILLFPDKADTLRGRHLAMSILEHGIMWVNIILELIIVFHRFRETWFWGSVASLSYGVIYLGWNFMWYGINGVYVYPSLQEEQGPGGRAGTYLGIFAALIIFYLLLRWFSNRIWRSALAVGGQGVTVNSKVTSSANTAGGGTFSGSNPVHGQGATAQHVLPQSYQVVQQF